MAPALRPVNHNLSWPRASHGGGGVRLARPQEGGLDEATDLLRAALWPCASDAHVGTLPVRARLEAAAVEGAPRSPLRLAPDPFAPLAAYPAATTPDLSFASAAAPAGEQARESEGANGNAEDSDAFRSCRASGGGGGGSGDERAFPSSPPLTPTTLRSWWSPPRSPFGLLEEILWADEWKLLVACMMLNCTTRLQVDRVLWRLFLLVPSPEEAVRLGAEAELVEGDADEGGGKGALVVASGRSGGLAGGRGGSGRGGGGGSGILDGGGGAARRIKKSGLDRIMEILQPLGLHRKRAKALVRLSEDYLAATTSAAQQQVVPTPAPAPAAPDEALDSPASWAASAHAPVGSIPPTAPGPPPPFPPRVPPRRVPLQVPAASLHGVGVYAADAHAMFCEGLMGVAPRDHALRWWYAWAIERRESGRKQAAWRRHSLGEHE